MVGICSYFDILPMAKAKGFQVKPDNIEAIEKPPMDCVGGFSLTKILIATEKSGPASRP